MTTSPEQLLYEAAFKHAGVGMALVDLRGRFTSVNDAFCRIVSRSRDELLALDFQAITHPEDLDLDLTLLGRLVGGTLDSYDLEKRYLRGDGTQVWVLLTATVVRDASGAPERFIAQVQDISRRKLAESEMEAFFQASNDLLAVAGTAGRLELVNPAWSRTLGWSADELTTRPFLDFVHPDDRASTIAEAEAVYRGSPASAFRNRYLTKAGDYRVLEWRTRPMPGGRLYCVVLDVTGQIEKEQQLSWLAALVDSARDAVVGVDNDGRVVSWNPGAELLTGYSSAEMVGKGTEILLPPGTPHSVKSALLASPAQTHFAFELQRRRKDGSLVDVQMHASRVRDASGSPLGWAVVSRDFTEARRLRDALVKQVELYTAIARSLPRGAVTMFDRELRYVAAEGPELFELLQIAPDQIVGRLVAEASSPANREPLVEACRQALQGQSSELVATLRERHLLLRIAPVYDGQQIAGGLVLSLDVTERVLQEEALRQTQRLLEATLATITDGVVLLDDQRRVLLHNRAYQELLDLPRDMQGRGPEFLRAHLLELGGDVEVISEALAEPEALNEPRVSEICLSSDQRWLRRVMTRVHGLGQDFYLAVWRDITREHARQQQVAQEAMTDALTGIGNRRAAQLALQRALQLQDSVFIALFDVDHFKQVNDRHGHAAGDMVLKRIASVLSAECRGVDSAARWGGEEFMVILRSDETGARAFCDRVRRLVEEASFPGIGQVTLSGGMAACARPSSMESVVEAADRALYAAKAGGRNRIVGPQSRRSSFAPVSA